MKQTFCVFLLMLLAAFSVAADFPFPVGEELVYSVSWNGIPVAHSTVTTSMDLFEGREVLALRVRTRTAAFFNHIFKVDDRIESLIDPKTFLPIQFTKNMKEGSYRCHEITRFDFEAKLAYYEHQTNGTKKEYAIDADTRDILSFMYFMRSELLESESTLNYRVMSDEKIYDLILHTDEVEKIDLPGYEKKIPSLKMVPEAKFDGLFVRKGKATLWVSRDDRRLLSFAKVKVPFGRARIKLQEVNGPGDDFWITEKKNDD
ncbi:MAG: DUF3108 domain-containing protein [Kiritimatiellales bacterium]|nr:DUF3108 domain-containing protein [Kiritimatiellales bacterium]